ncbi:MAG: TIGR03545 family protein [Thermodesulfobacteriota bacterium]
MKMIRWSGLIAFIVIVGLITIFTLFFLDGILKGIIEDQASLAVGAKVEIGDLRFKILGLSIDIQKLQIANPEEPMRNSIEIGSLAFDLRAAPLLRKKIVIERMKVLDLAWNTLRKTSGALPPRLQKKLEARKKPSELGAKAVKRIEECVLPNFSLLADLKKRSPEELLKGVNLQSAALLGDYPKRISSTRETWEKRLKELPTREEIEKDIKSLQAFKDQRPRDLTQLPAHLEKLNALQKKINDTQKTLTTAQQEFQTEMNRLKTSLQEVEKFKDADVKTVMAKLGVQIPSATDLICVLLGKEVAYKVNWALGIYRKLSQYTSKGKPKEEKEKPKPVPRMKGMDVRFPITRGYPDFLLEWAEFSARPDVKKAPGVFAFEKLAGELRGLTSHPALYGKPTLFKLNGSMVGTLAKDFALAGQLDHRSAVADDRIDLSVKELRVERAGTSDPHESPLRLASALLNVNGFLRVKGEELNGRVLLDVLHPRVAVGSSAAILGDLLKNLGSFDLSLAIGGTLDQPTLGLSSSATKTLTAGLENLVQKELKGLQDGIKIIISSRIDKDLTTQRNEVTGLEKLIQGELSSRLGLTSLLIGPAPKGTRGLLPGFK